MRRVGRRTRKSPPPRRRRSLRHVEAIEFDALLERTVPVAIELGGDSLAVAICLARDDSTAPVVQLRGVENSVAIALGLLGPPIAVEIEPRGSPLAVVDVGLDLEAAIEIVVAFVALLIALQVIVPAGVG